MARRAEGGSTPSTRTCRGGRLVRPVESRPSQGARSRGWRGLGVVLGEGAKRDFPRTFREDPYM